MTKLWRHCRDDVTAVMTSLPWWRQHCGGGGCLVSSQIPPADEYTLCSFHVNHSVLAADFPPQRWGQRVKFAFSIFYMEIYSDQQMFSFDWKLKMTSSAQEAAQHNRLQQNSSIRSDILPLLVLRKVLYYKNWHLTIWKGWFTPLGGNSQSCTYSDLTRTSWVVTFNTASHRRMCP